MIRLQRQGQLHRLAGAGGVAPGEGRLGLGDGGLGADQAGRRRAFDGGEAGAEQQRTEAAGDADARPGRGGCR